MSIKRSLFRLRNPSATPDTRRSSARHLRLTRDAGADRSTKRTARADSTFSSGGRQTTALLNGPTDPRWVMAVRTAEQLQGAILSPEKRERLIKLGKTMGLSPFDANLIIAIVQDQARRGCQPTACPLAGEAQLAMIPAPSTAKRLTAQLQQQKGLRLVTAITIFVLVEVVVLKWLWF